MYAYTSSGDNLGHLLKKGFFFHNPILWLPNRLGLQGKFWQDSQNIEALKSRENTATKRFFELNSFTVIVNSGAKKDLVFVQNKLTCNAPINYFRTNFPICYGILPCASAWCGHYWWRGSHISCSNSIIHSRVPIAVALYHTFLHCSFVTAAALRLRSFLMRLIALAAASLNALDGSVWTAFCHVVGLHPAPSL